MIAAPSSRSVIDLVALLDEGGCLGCRVAGRADATWLRWFRTEKHAEPATRRQLAADLGVCPAHLRALVAGEGPGGPLTDVLAGVVNAAAGVLAGSSGGTPGCHACVDREAAVDRELASLLERLAVAEVAAALTAAGGLCLRHLRTVLAAGGPASGLRVVVEVARTRAEAADEATSLLTALVGRDVDARRRARLRAHRPPPVDVGQPLLAQVLDELEPAACPVCRAREDGLQAYLDHLGGELARTDPGRAIEPPVLCATHLEDLAAGDHSALLPVARAARAALLEGLAGLEVVLAGVRDPGPAGVWAALRAPPPGGRRLQPGRVLAPVREAAARLLPEPTCPACRAVDRVEQRRQQRLAAVQDDPRVAAGVQRAHGWCLVHVLGARRSGTPIPVVERTAATRLAAVGWELEEARRHEDVVWRHEPVGSEALAWARAVVLLDGRAALGHDAVAMRGALRG